jgi:S1-C subfamily serine protease
MRPGRGPLLLLLAVAAAVVGGAIALAIGAGAGWIGNQTKTVVVKAQSAPQTELPAAVRSPAQPIPGNGFDPARIFASRSPGVVTIFAFFGGPGSVEGAQGSGFVISSKGYILTNSHVITNAGEVAARAVKPASHVFVEFSDRDRTPATVVGWDVYDDVGLIKVDPRGHRLTPVPLGDSSSVVVGEPVAAIGSPLGNEDSLSVGVVSAVHRAIRALTVARYNIVDAIQTDAAITHGNSGGPLFDARGRVIGINAQIRSQSGTGNDSGVGFAVPIDAAKRSVSQLVRRHHDPGSDALAREGRRLLGQAGGADRGRLAEWARRRRRTAREREDGRRARVLGPEDGRRCHRRHRRQAGPRCRRRRPHRLLRPSSGSGGDVHDRPRHDTQDRRRHAR